jgi:hypothetical protein
MTEMRLYDIRLTVERIENRSVCGLAVCDYFEVAESNRVRIPEGKHFRLYARRRGELVRGRAPSSRSIALSCAHVAAALCLGAVILGYDRPFAGLDYGRGLLIQLHVALLGWIRAPDPDRGAETSVRCSRGRSRTHARRAATRRHVCS